ncbi:hypothetical protein KR032_005697 [Drosophila birchii]|nr:hypothetical protein KR032_005697 [Drosophila birchii]
MSVIQFGPRSLLRNLAAAAAAAAALPRMYGKGKKVTQRPWRPDLESASDPVPCYMSLTRSENSCNDPRLKTTDADMNLAIRKRSAELSGDEEPDSAVPCYKALCRSENRCNSPRLKIPEECITDPCDWAPIPMDIEHYTPSDKYTRKYQRTWCELYVLPNKFVAPTKRYPNRPRRKLSRKTASAECVETIPEKGRKRPETLIEVQRIGKWPCCKLVAPGCKPARQPPSCSQHFPRSCCKKRRTQYPSFSECLPEGLLDPIPPCECIKQVNLCDVWAYLRRIGR